MSIQKKGVINSETERPFVCEGCGRAYGSLSSYKQHARYYCRNRTDTMSIITNRNRINKRLTYTPTSEVDVNLAAYILLTMASSRYSSDVSSDTEDEYEPDLDVDDGIRTTYNQKLGVYKCICGSSLISRGSAIRHKRFSCVLSRPIKKYGCNRCSKTYKQKQTLNRHKTFFCKHSAK